MSGADSKSLPPIVPTVPSPDQPVPDEFDLVCEHCGYSLVGLVGDRCPECGETFDPNDLPLARVPWLFRKRLGTFAAYGDTALSILIRPTAFAKELCRPVRISADDARQFRRLSIRTAMFACLLAGAIGVTQLPVAALLAEIKKLQGRELGQAISSLMLIPWGIVMLYILFPLMTDLPTFIWRGLESKPMDLAPLHHYASAPLALLLGGLVPLAVLMLLAANGSTGPAILVCGVIIEVYLIVVFFWLWITALLFMKQATGCGVGRVIGLALYLPLHWFLIFFMCAAAWGAGYVVVNAVLQLFFGN